MISILPWKTLCLYRQPIKLKLILITEMPDMKRTNRVLILLLILAFSHISHAQTLSRSEYKEKLRGFWLGSCIANWTGLKTEGKRNCKPYFTDDDWNTYQGHEWLSEEIENGAYLDFELMIPTLNIFICTRLKPIILTSLRVNRSAINGWSILQLKKKTFYGYLMNKHSI
jgi:hypothetical protein